MKIGLLDVDKYNGISKSFPNIALMKFSTFHKNKGDEVELYNQLCEYDLVYVSKIFDKNYSKEYPYKINGKRVIYGGLGYNNYDTSFIDNYEKLMPDYSIYSIDNVSYGFLTKGCPRNCKFCLVGQIDGATTYKVADLSDWLNEDCKYIEICDPNMLAFENHLELLQQLLDSNKIINFNQGLDVRLLNDENVELLRKMKIKRFNFAWDNPQENLLSLFDKWRDKLTSNKNRSDYSKFQVYVLVNFNSTPIEDLYRVEKLKAIGYDPYIMIYDKPSAPLETKRLQRWVNMKSTFRSCCFEEYQKKTTQVINGQLNLIIESR